MSKVFKTAGGELYTVGIGRLAIIVSGTKSYSDEVWVEYCAICREMSNPALPYLAAFNYSPIVGPSASQRKTFNSEVGDLNKHFKRVVLVSDSAIVRGALTATAWITRSDMQMRPYSPARVDEGFAWLAEVAEFNRDDAKKAFLDLVRQQGDDPVGMLKQRDNIPG